jgi:hypothetical protein
MYIDRTSGSRALINDLLSIINTTIYQDWPCKDHENNFGKRLPVQDPKRAFSFNLAALHVKAD